MSTKYIKTKELCIASSHTDDIRKIFNYFKDNYSDYGLGMVIPPSHDKLYICCTYKAMRLAKGTQTLYVSCDLTAPPLRLNVTNFKDFLCKYCMSWVNDAECASFAIFWGHITLESLKSVMAESLHSIKNKEHCKTLLSKGACHMVLEGDAPLNQLGVLIQAEQELKKLQNNRQLDLPRGQYGVFTNCEEYGEIRIYSYAFNEEEFSDFGSDGKIPKFILRKNNDNVEYREFSELYKQIMIKKKHYYIYSNSSNKGKTLMCQQLLQQFNCAEITDMKNFADVDQHAQFYLIDEYDHTHKFSFDALKRFTGGNAASFAGNIKSFGKSFSPRPDAQLIIFSNHHIFALYGQWDAKLQRHFITPHHAEILNNRFHIIKVDPCSGSIENDARSYKHPSTWSDNEVREEIGKLFDHYIGKQYLDIPISDVGKQYAGKRFLKRLENLIHAHNDGLSPHLFIPLDALAHLPYCAMIDQRVREDTELYSTIML